MRRGFTLLEVLIAAALGLFLTGLTLTIYRNARLAVDRAQARLELHQRARTMYEAMQDSSLAMQHTTLIAAISLASDRTTPATLAAKPGRVDLVFMRGTTSDLDWRPSNSRDTYRRESIDTVWERWTWDRNEKRLYKATSRKAAIFQNQDKTWKDPATGVNWQSDWPGQTFGILAQPRRSIEAIAANPAAGVAARIAMFEKEMDGNRWGTMKMEQNAGDATDLAKRKAVLMDGVEDLVIDVVCGDGKGGGTGLGVRLDNSQDRCQIYDGLYVDGTATAAEIARRPRLLRVRFTLASRNFALRQGFSYSFPLTPFAGN